MNKNNEKNRCEALQTSSQHIYSVATHSLKHLAQPNKTYRIPSLKLFSTTNKLEKIDKEMLSLILILIVILFFLFKIKFRCPPNPTDSQTNIYNECHKCQYCWRSPLIFTFTFKNQNISLMAIRGKGIAFWGSHLITRTSVKLFNNFCFFGQICAQKKLRWLLPIIEFYENWF